MVEVVAAVIIENGQVLLASRPADKPPAGWEFPGGKVEPGESLFDAVKRELLEELALEAEPVRELHTIVNEKLTLHFIQALRKENSIPCALEGQEYKWIALTAEIPAGLLANDFEFWKILAGNKINPPAAPL